MGITSKSSTLAIGFCFPVLGAILVASRFYCRWAKKAGRGIDDWLCLPALAFVTGACGSLLAGVFRGAFFVDTDDEAAVENQGHLTAQVTGALVIFWLFANATIKFSIVFFYRRIFVGRVFNRWSWALLALSGIWLIYAFLSWILYCGTHVKADFEGPFTECPLWGTDIQMGVFAMDSFIDFFLLVLPVPFVWRLQIRRTRKLLLIVVFIIGAFAFVAGLNNTAVQLIYLTQANEEADLEGAEGQATGLLFSNWPCIEVGVGLIACNLPTISIVGTRVTHEYVLRGWNSLASIISPRRSHQNFRPSAADNAPAGSDADLGRSDWTRQRGAKPGQGALSDSDFPLVHVKASNRSGEGVDRPAQSSGDADHVHHVGGQAVQGFSSV